MLFHSQQYAVFLIFVFLVFWLLARYQLLRLLFLLAASYFFYACSNPWFLLLIIGSSATDYLAGRAMVSAQAAGQFGKKKLFLVVSLVVNLGLLGVFKYANFFYGTAVDLSRLLGGTAQFNPLAIMLPVGISFYTFQSMSYSIDLYRGRIPLERSFLRFFLFVGFFPQLVAGPIVRAVDFLPQLDRKPFISRDQAGRALWLIAVGLLKKVVLADYLALNLVDRVFDAPNQYSSIETLVGLYGYTMQVFLDFSAYSEIAIGSALLLGYHLPDNFNRPYAALSVTDFWRRWHMTLGAWLRDYLYYPLGGSRGTDGQTYRNLLITFLLIGLWHGADWTFAFYGLLHAVAMCVNRYFRVNLNRRRDPAVTAWGRSWRVLLTLNFIVLARIFFRCQSFDHAWEVLAALAQGTGGFSLMTPLLWTMLLGSYLLHWTPQRWTAAQAERFERFPALVQGPAFAALVIFVMRRAVSDGVPFVYFRF